MALPNQVLPGFSASLWCQTGSTPTPFTVANLATWTGEVATIVGTVANGTGTAGEQLNVEAIPKFGQDDASANFYVDRKSTRLNSSHSQQSRMPSSA